MKTKIHKVNIKIVFFKADNLFLLSLKIIFKAISKD